MDLNAENALQIKLKVSSNAFLQRFAAPTFPPVKCKTAYSREAASSIDEFVGLGALPFRNRRDRADNAAYEGLWRVGYSGISRASVVSMRTLGVKRNSDMVEE